MPQTPVAVAEASRLNLKRSKSTMLIQMNLPLATVKVLRTWAASVGGRTGVVVAELIAKEVARQEERERVRQGLDETE